MTCYYMPKLKKKVLEIMLVYFILQDLWPAFKSRLLRIFICEPYEAYMSSFYWKHEAQYFKVFILHMEQNMSFILSLPVGTLIPGLVM